MLGRLVCSRALLDLELVGRNIIVTGANSGHGKHLALQLLKQGATVILACRNVPAGELVVQQSERRKLRGTAVVMELDVSSAASVREFFQKITSQFEAVHCLVNNAGCMNCPLSKTVDGIELQFGCNYLGPWLLTQLLLPLLEASGDGRIVNVSSANHDMFAGRRGHLDLDDLSFERRPYNGWAGYAQSKLAQVLHVMELTKRHPSITAVAIHPGSLCTNVTRYMMSYRTRMLIAPLERLFSGQVTTWVGIQTGLHCILSDRSTLQSGAYYAQHRSPFGAKGGWPHMSGNPEANDEELAAKLWELSALLMPMLGHAGVPLDRYAYG
jgi:NAD(P)-dependent dehydrogenase (short-subunit alcohol dehydrogenase family)